MLKRIGIHILRLSTLGILVGLLWVCGFIWFMFTLPLPQGTVPGGADAIVVLTGGEARIPEGLELLDAGHAEKLFISGVYKGVEVQEIVTLSRKDPARFSTEITLGYEAGNTHENATEAASWLKATGARSFYLVTSGYHMRRAILEFRLALPSGIRLIPHPVKPQVMTEKGWWKQGRLFSLMVLEYTKYLLTLPKTIPLLFSAT